MSTSSSPANPEPTPPLAATPAVLPQPHHQPPPKARFIIATAVCAIALFFGLSYLAENWSRESTDDAFIDAHISSIASRVAGEVKATHVVENQAVKAGDLLAELDPRDFENRVNQKRAALESSQANQRVIKAGFDMMRARVVTAEATKKQSEAEAEAAKSTYENAQANLERARSMWTNDGSKVISAQDFDAAKWAMNSAKANWEADVQKIASDASKVIESRAQITTAEQLYEQAGAQANQSQADLHAAELELSYTKIIAPVDGRVTRKQVEKGTYVQVGQPLLAIVRPEVWVTANFKETQTARMKAGQSVRIKVDGLAAHTYRGHVVSLQSGSGARFSLLPPENAVGNYVKVVQRVPVKIEFDEPMQATEGLGPGMSASPSVQIADRVVSDLAIAIIVLILAPATGAALWFFLQHRSQNQK